MKKGFTLVELIISFSIISIVSLALFKTVLYVQQEEKEEVQYNSYIAFSYVLNNEIQSDFLTKKIIEIHKYSSSYYSILFEDGTSKTIKYENGYIIYGTLKEELPSGYELYGGITFSTYKSSGKGLNSYVLLNIPLKNTNSLTYSDLNYMYQFDSNETIVPAILEE